MKTKQRSENQMMGLILNFAKANDNIQTVVLNGSRASPTGQKDIFQDYDIIYIVNDVSPFVADKSWIASFGDMLIMQTPDEMDGVWQKSQDKFTYLMRFTDGNRIDLSLMTLKKYQTHPRDSQSVLLLDKQNALGEFEPPSDQDYLPTPPTEKDFKDCCNEFLWVSTYVVKGIYRKQLLYAKQMAENCCKQELIKMMSWLAAINSKHQQPLGAYCKNLEDLIATDLWSRLCQTYVSADYKEIWQGLFKMLELFDSVAGQVADNFNFTYDHDEYNRVYEYLKEVKSETDD